MVVTNRVSRREAARDFDAILGALSRTKEPVVVEDGGRAVAVLVSPDEFEAWQRQDLLALLDEWQRANAGSDPAGVLADVAEAVEAVRRRPDERPRR
jgi:PHD/YefM family antitoxin component YafN of YafNO toxin-antitoxin module